MSSQEKEINKICNLLLVADKSYFEQTGISPMPLNLKAKYLFNNGIRSAGGFELDVKSISFIKGMKYKIQPIKYKPSEENNG